MDRIIGGFGTKCLVLKDERNIIKKKLYRVIGLYRQVEKDKMKCERCGDNLQDHNEWFFRCPQCALLKQKEGTILE